MFLAGGGINPAAARRCRGRIFSTSLMGILLPFGLGLGLVTLFPGLWHSQLPEKLIYLASFIGVALAVSALPVIARILVDLNLLDGEIGTVVLAAAAIDDLVAWSLFAVILNGVSPSGASPVRLIGSLFLTAVLALFFLSVGRRAIATIVRRAQSAVAVPPERVLGAAVVLVLVTAAVTERLGVHAFFGAFLVGAAMAGLNDERRSLEQILQPFVYGFFAPLYFASVGLKANFIAHFDLGLVLAVLLVASVGKIGGAGLGAWLGRMPAREALAVGVGMNARGAVGLLLASLALDYGIIDVRVFVALVVLALVSTVSSSVILRRLMEAKTA